MRTSFHHQPEAQHPNFQLSTSWQADYPIFGALCGLKSDIARGPRSANIGHVFFIFAISLDALRRPQGSHAKTSAVIAERYRTPRACHR